MKKNNKSKKGPTQSTEKGKPFSKKKPGGKSKKRDEKQEIFDLESKYPHIDPTTVQTFADLPLSSNTFKGLKKHNFVTPTPIQRNAIIPALQGKDVLGAAKTGSGKTLAFLVPLLERLFCKQWTKFDGVGALVISPTRELSRQIFQCLTKLLEFHELSYGLVIGGEGLKEERDKISRCNIIICTPGRLLQHMNETYLFACDNLQVLVLDEADRCLDMGFKHEMNAIIENLPVNRQTLLFSATQTTSVRDLARLSLKDPAFVSADKEFTTPDKLMQIYVECQLDEKMTILWNFLKMHSKQKMIIFLSNCKSCKYVYEILKRLGLKMDMFALYGTLHQQRRNAVYEEFVHTPRAVLFATDLAARGLDFPSVHWVVQFDCPEDTATYIHRVGRTARYERGGESLLLLLPSEKAMLYKLKEKGVPIEEMAISSDKMINPVMKIKQVLANNQELIETAQRAVVSYVKSLFWAKDKDVFDVDALDIEAFALSLGLLTAPRMRFLERKRKKDALKKNPNMKVFISDDEDQSGSEHNSDDEKKKKDKETITSNVLKELKGDSTRFYAAEYSDEDDTYVLDNSHELPPPPELETPDMAMSFSSKRSMTKEQLAKKALKQRMPLNKKIVFDDEGEDASIPKRLQLAVDCTNEDNIGMDIEKAKMFIKEEDIFDKQLFKEKIKKRHKAEKQKAKEEKLKKEKEKKMMKDEQESEKDEFGLSSDEDECDLSWLPNPDKIYGDNINSEEENNSENDSMDENDEEEEIIIKEKSLKRKRKAENLDIIKVKKKSKLPDPGSLSVNEAEELALLLLGKK